MGLPLGIDTEADFPCPTRGLFTDGTEGEGACFEGAVGERGGVALPIVPRLGVVFGTMPFFPRILSFDGFAGLVERDVAGDCADSTSRPFRGEGASCAGPGELSEAGRVMVMKVSTRRELRTFSSPFWVVFRNKSGKMEELDVPMSPEGTDEEDGALRETCDAEESVLGRWVDRTGGGNAVDEECRVMLGLEEPVEVESGMLALEDVLLLSVGSPERSKLP